MALGLFDMRVAYMSHSRILSALGPLGGLALICMDLLLLQ